MRPTILHWPKPLVHGASALVVTVLLAACAVQPAVLTPPASRASAALTDADTLRVTLLARGVWHIYARHRSGPWAIHIVEIDQSLCRPRLQARKPAATLSARATTSALTGAALAGINADFFMLPGGTPVGAHVTAAVPLIGPTDRQVFAVADQTWWIGVARLDGAAAHRADSARLVQLNRPARAFSAYRGTNEGLTLFTTWSGDSVAADSAAWRVRLRMINGNESRGRGVVTSVEAAATATPLSTGEAVLLAHRATRAWAQRRSAGDTVSWRARVPLTGPEGVVAAQEVVGGFPELLRGGVDVLGTQTVRPEFGEQRHPRTAIGWSADRARLFFVVVDGRQSPYSDGMSLRELSWLFRRIGASDALNLDGGGSTALVIRGRLINRPSDQQGERPVGNALVLAQCARR
jgi:hypothetical protein